MGLPLAHRPRGLDRGEIPAGVAMTEAKHGHARRRRHSCEYRTWSSMLHRCRCPNAIGYENYGGRGITVCSRWEKFENFLADMGRRPSGKLSLDRIDPNGNYEPDNCRWATREVQSQNRRHHGKTASPSVLMTLNGETLPAPEWGRRLGMSRNTIYARRNAGWTDHKILTTPPRPKKGANC